MSERFTPKYDRHWLEYRESLQAPMRPGAASKTVVEYLESIGFEQTETTPTMSFARGSQLASLYNPNPRSQKTYVRVDVVSGASGSVVELTMRINRLGNLPLQPDYEFWQTEIDGLEQALLNGYSDARLSEFASERARLHSIVIMQRMIMAAMVLLIMVLLTVGAL